MDPAFDTLVILDFEATCEDGGAPSPQEIIELPSVLVSLRERRVLDDFGTFVRPIFHPRLSPFCHKLTSIRQEDVDAAPAFPQALERHLAWLRGHGLLDAPDRFAFVTCGDWDLSTMLPTQCAASGPPITDLPPAYRRWINIKKIFAGQIPRAKSNGMASMLRTLGLELVGTHHRGIDDCHNIARIALALAARGAAFRITAKLAGSRYPELPLTLEWQGTTHTAVLKKRSLPALLGLASGLFHRQMARVFADDGRELGADDDLFVLRPGATLRMASAREQK